jgi:hypothetical protein
MEAFPWDPAIGAYFEDNEWSLRVALQRPRCFRRSREAIAIHRITPRPLFEQTFRGRTLLCDWLASLAFFQHRFDRLLSPWSFLLVPELNLAGGDIDLAGLRLLLALVRHHGSDWVFAEWANGRLAGLFEANRRL